MKLTKRNGLPAPEYLTVTRTWTYNVNQAAEALAEFTDGPISYEDVHELISSWVVDDVREPVGENLPAIQEVYGVTEDTSQEPNEARNTPSA